MNAYTDKWQGKVALVTGGSSGIGLAAAEWLAARGAHVWLVSRREDKLAAALDRLPCRPEQACGMAPADVSDPKQVAAAVEQVTVNAGTPDLLINCAGVTHPGYVQDLSLEIFHWMMDVNYFGTVNMTKSVLPGMLVRGTGHIVNISSMAGLIGITGYTAYGSSKFAVRGFSDTLRVEMKPFGIQVSVAYPGDTETPQLKYEIPLRPEEQKAVNTIPVLPVEKVAHEILVGVSRGKYVILPGTYTKLFYFLSSVFTPAVYPVLDWMIARSRKKA
jgi:3-dehydrosphinganine reductase